jgi:apolipoprotein D and lipocalin family protein
MNMPVKSEIKKIRVRRGWTALGGGGALLVVGLVLWLWTGCASRPPLRTAGPVDLERYAGLWYEIARYPNWFQRSCTGLTTAEYTPLPDGKIQVVNRCQTRSGAWKDVKGTATVVPGTGNARLRVGFGGPIKGDYWIIGLDRENYSWAVVGHPSRQFLWFLAREQTVAPAVWEQMVAIARAEGYDVDRLIRRE